MIDTHMIGTVMQFHIDENDPETFVIGQLIQIDDKWFLLRSISPSGKWDGFMLCLLSDIVSVQQDGDYLEKMTLLLTLRDSTPPDIPYINQTALINLFTYAKEADSLIAFELYMSGKRDVIGNIQLWNDNTVHIAQIDEFGKADGETLVLMDAITRAFVSDDELICLELLKNYYHSTGKELCVN